MPKNNQNTKQDIQNSKQNAHNSNQDISITALQTDVGWIKKDVIEVKTAVNRLETSCIPSINTTLSKLDTNQKLLLGFMTVIIVALVGLFFK